MAFVERRMERQDERVQASRGAHRARLPDGGGGLRKPIQESGREEHDVQRGEEGAADSGGRRVDAGVHRAQRHHHHL